MFKKLLIIAWVGLVGLTAACKGPQGDVGPKVKKVIPELRVQPARQAQLEEEAVEVP